MVWGFRQENVEGDDGRQTTDIRLQDAGVYYAEQDG
jgi:hypothetical protein